MRRPETFWTDPFIRRLSDYARMILRWAWDNADSDGRVCILPETLRAAVWAGSKELGTRASGAPALVNIKGACGEITEAGRWCLYLSPVKGTPPLLEGGVYDCVTIVQLRSWKKLTRPRRPAQGDLPGPPVDVLAAYEEKWGELDTSGVPRTSAEVEARKVLLANAKRVYRGWLEITERTDVSDEDSDEYSVSFTTTRKDKVLKRLSEGATFETIMAAAEYAHGNDFLMGRKGDRAGNTRLDDLVDICKNSERLGKWSQAGEGGDGGGGDDVDAIRRRTIEANRKAGGRGGRGRGRGGRGR